MMPGLSAFLGRSLREPEYTLIPGFMHVLVQHLHNFYTTALKSSNCTTRALAWPQV